MGKVVVPARLEVAVVSAWVVWLLSDWEVLEVERVVSSVGSSVMVALSLLVLMLL